MKKLNRVPNLKSDKGLVTLDYLFAFVLIVGLGTVLFALSLTLTVVEVTQYITFASARTYSAAHHTQEKQIQLGEAKYQALTTNRAFANFFNNSGWFEIGPPEIRDHSQTEYQEDFTQQGGEKSPFHGVRVSFLSKVLDFRIPFYGSTTNDKTQGGFSTYVGSYLSREPSMEECQTFNDARWGAIQSAVSNGGGSAVSLPADNGC